MKKIFLVCRILLGIILLTFGANGFLNFYPLPPTTPASHDFQQALWNSHYLMQLVKGIEIISGCLLLLNRYVPLALLLVLPVTVNIFFIDLFLQPGFLLMGGMVFLLNVVLIIKNRDHYKGILISPSV